MFSKCPVDQYPVQILNCAALVNIKNTNFVETVTSSTPLEHKCNDSSFVLMQHLARAFQCCIYMFFLCQHGFIPGTLASSHDMQSVGLPLHLEWATLSKKGKYRKVTMR